MALNLDTTFKLKAKVEGAKSVDNFKKQLSGLDKSSKMSKVQLGKMNIEINRMARAAGNTTKGIREHIKALTALRERTDIGGQAYKRLGGQIDGLKKKLKGLDGQAASTGTKLATMLATVGVGRAIGGIVRGASNYQEEVKKTAAIEGGGANFAQIDESIRATAQVAAGTPQEVAELATSLARAGFDADQISGSLKGIVLGAEATSTSFADMGSIVANNINAFGLEISDTEGLVDILVASANSANQTVTDLGESLKYAAPVAKTFGLTVNDTAATISLLAQAGIKGSDAGTALRSGLSRLQIAASGSKGELLGLTRGSKMLTKAMEALGADILDTEGNLKPMDEVLLSMKHNLEGFDSGQKAEISKALFGQEQGSKFLALLGRSDAEITNMFESVRNSAEVTKRTREAMASFGLTTKILGGNLQVVTNQIGAAMISVLDPLAKLLNNLLTAASRLPTPIKGIASAFAAAGLAAAGYATIMLTVKNLGVGNAIKPLITSLKGIAVGFVGAAKAAVVFLATNPFGWAILAVAAIVAVLVKFKGLREAILNLGKNIINFFKPILKNIAVFMVLYAQLVKFIISKFVKIGSGLVDLLKQFFNFSKSVIKTVLQIGGQFVKIINTHIVTPLAKLREQFIDFRKGVVKTFNDIGKKFVEMINKFIINNLKKLAKIPLIGKLFGLTQKTFFKLGEIAVDVTDDAKEAFKNAENIVVDVTDKAGKALNNAKDIVNKGVGKAITSVTDGASNIIGGGTTTPINEDTANEQNKVLDGMKAGLDDYLKKAGDLANNVKDAFNNALQGMEDALVNFVMTGKLAFDDLARSIIANITRIFIQQTIMLPFGNLLRGIFPFLNNAKGNAFAGGKQLQEYAYGGVVSRPTIFPMKDGLGLMGEAGAEAIMPLKRGKDGKLGVMSQGGGVNNVTVNVDASNSNVESDTGEAEQLGLAISEAIQAELIEQQRPGGLLYN